MFGVQRIIAEFCDVHKSTFRVRELHCLISVFIANLAKALCDCPAGFAEHVLAVAAATAVVAAVVDCGQLSLPAMASGE